jgi:hypothetical protein
VSDFPQDPPLPLFVHTLSRWSGVQDMANLNAGLSLASLTNPSANLAKYIPVTLPWPYPVKRVFWVNSSSVTSTNFDFGIYTGDGRKVYSTGSTAASGASLPQYVTPGTSFILSAGRYYFGLSCSSITASRGGQGTTSMSIADERMVGMLQEASALPLPATMTGVAVANPYIVLCGVTRTASGF